MILNAPIWPGGRSRRAKAWIVAAIALVLNWMAPAPLPFYGGSPSSGASATLSPGARAHPVSPPRVLPRSVAADIGLPNVKKGESLSGGKPAAIRGNACAILPDDIRPAYPNPAQQSPTRVAAAAFDARAPPTSALS